jgi:hypothetical protein
MRTTNTRLRTKIRNSLDRETRRASSKGRCPFFIGAAMYDLDDMTYEQCTEREKQDAIDKIDIAAIVLGVVVLVAEFVVLCWLLSQP